MEGAANFVDLCSSSSFSGDDDEVWTSRRRNFVVKASDGFQADSEGIAFTIHGRPPTQLRYRTGWNGRRYSPSKPVQDELRSLLRNVLVAKGLPAFRFRDNQPLLVDCCFAFPPNGSRNDGDLDNLVKFLLDSLQDAKRSTVCRGLFKNDSQIFKLLACKGTSASTIQGYTRVAIKKIETNNL